MRLKKKSDIISYAEKYIINSEIQPKLKRINFAHWLSEVGFAEDDADYLLKIYDKWQLEDYLQVSYSDFYYNNFLEQLNWNRDRESAKNKYPEVAVIIDFVRWFIGKSYAHGFILAEIEEYLPKLKGAVETLEERFGGDKTCLRP